ncbi:MAG TPA: TAT-variant-translocated molybdopterin oxidoreductase [Gemmataceae bacterium]|nr:TAT-variant-translocated molybdopterin oxidoreductase [Gemmataceae bacterium]
MDLDALRQRLATGGGRSYWRGLEELAETPEFRALMEREFPDDADKWLDPVTRRRFLVLMGASLALAGVAGCSPRPAPHAKIMPYVHQPEEIIPGKPLFYATAMTLGGSGVGLLVESHEGRPTKVEGNPKHPASLGATDVFAQASILGLYDPDRSATVRYRGRPRGWNDALAALRAAIDKLRQRKGAGLRLLTETVVSPTLAGQLDALLRDFPEARWHQWEPTARHQALAGTRQAFGDNANVSVHYNFEDADVILALDADFLYWGPGHLRYARQFIDRRRVRVGRMPMGEDAEARLKEAAGRVKMNRLYAVECTPTITGAKADHRLALRAGAIEDLARAVATKLGLPAGGEAGPYAKWVAAVAKDLGQHRGRSIVLAGDGQPPAVHAIAHALNQTLGNFGKTVHFTRPVEHRPEDQVAGLRALVEDMKQNRVDLLFVLGANPVFTAPADLDFAGALANMKPGSLRVHHGLYLDETAFACDWHLPETHFLEAWSDTRAFDGTASIVQPLIAPLFSGRSAHEVLAFFTEYPERLGYDIVRDYWRGYHQKHGGGDFEAFWQKGLRDGVLDDLAKEYTTPQTPTLRDNWAGQPPAPAGPLPAGQVEVVFAPDPAVYDGRFANSAWLQELPKPLTKLTWDNAALLSPNTARQYGLTSAVAEVGGEHGQIIVNRVTLQVGDRKLILPAWIMPGHPDDCVTLHLGYGHKLDNLEVANGAGFDVYPLRTADAPWIGRAKIGKAEGRVSLACVEFHHPLKNGEDMKSQAVVNRKPVHALTLAQFKEDPKLPRFMVAGEHEEEEIRAQLPGPYERLTPMQEATTEPPSQTEGKKEPPDRRLTPLTLYPKYDYRKEYRWAMGIDLTACVGCNACVVACQAENNIPVVGKSEVMRGREMHWLRVDRYYYPADGEKAGPDDLERPLVFFQPVPCQQCEKAPCELVCPVEATAHSHDGLNDMTYNRCVGTRYCSNNCPYKVRRFNFLFYADFVTESLKLQRNPDVTVRSRGVMEKCTYCVQRLREADITAEKRLVRTLEAARQAAGGSLSPEEEDRIRRRSRVQDGEVMTACQQACPAGAIIFGDLNAPGRDGDGHSDVYRWKEEPTNYGLLAGLNTQPRTTYLAALRNPNPELERMKDEG